MRVIKDTRPRYRVQGNKWLKGVSFHSMKDAQREMEIQSIATILWREKLNGKSIYEFATAIHKNLEKICKAGKS